MHETFFKVRHYNLPVTLTSGQVFRWENRQGAWEGVVRDRWVRLTPEPRGIIAQTVEEPGNWDWLKTFLQLDISLKKVLRGFPQDPVLQKAVQTCRGLRLLRQEPWECLASFICSSSKQILQITQILRLLCERFGKPVPSPPGAIAAYSFPGPKIIAGLSEKDLRACKMGFRAPYLKSAATQIAQGDLSLADLQRFSYLEARARLMEFPGVGEKVANCVLLFAYEFPEAFPVDVWIKKALQQLYFRGRQIKPPKLARFVATHFGAHGGYAQQYLFHYMRKIRSV